MPKMTVERDFGIALVLNSYGNVEVSALYQLPQIVLVCGSASTHSEYKLVVVHASTANKI